MKNSLFPNAQYRSELIDDIFVTLYTFYFPFIDAFLISRQQNVVRRFTRIFEKKNVTDLMFCR